MNLNKNHLQDLKASGLSDQTIQAANLHSANREEAKIILGFDPRCPGLVFPYSSDNGETFFRIKPDEPYKGAGEKRPAKYLTPKNQTNCLYIPPTLDRAILNDPTVFLLVTEGEKKALKACQEGFACVALSGVWCFRTKDEKGISHPIPDFDRVSWDSRPVCIVYDSDAVTNPQVKKAEKELAWELESRGATIKVVRLPEGHCAYLS